MIDPQWGRLLRRSTEPEPTGPDLLVEVSFARPVEQLHRAGPPPEDPST